MVQDAAQIKDRIVSILMRRGPSIPVNISKEIGLTILFTSAFLSELAADKTVKISNMRVGSSPVYYLPGQEASLERFSQFLKSREKDAFLMIREKKFLKDKEQVPAIRVALREIRDFAVPFSKNEEVIWRYYLVPESEFKIEPKITIEEEKPEPILVQKVQAPLKMEEVNSDLKVEEKHPIIEVAEQKQERKQKLKRQPVIAQKKKKAMAKKDDGFFASIKDFLAKNSINLVDIENFGKNEIIMKVKENGKEKLLVAYNKNKITENDIINASKKSNERQMPYIILGKGGTLKKLDSLIEAVKNLSSIEKLK